MLDLLSRFRDGYDSRGVANIFVHLAKSKGRALCILEVIKYVYLAHGWYLGFYDKPLIYHKIEAWRTGPVVPKIYHAFRAQGIQIVMPATKYGYVSDEPYVADVDSDAKDIIEEIYDSYSKISPYALSGLLNEEGTPWNQVKDKGLFVKIPNKLIRDYYKEKIQKKAGSSSIV